MRLSAQPLQIVDEPVARVLRVLVMHPNMDRLLGAHLLAVAAEHAAKLVDLVDQRVAVAVLVLSRDELDADRHQARSSATEPATMRPRSSTKNSGIASSTFSPNSASANRVPYVQPSCSCRIQIAVAITVTYARASGSITFHPSAISWS